MTNFTQKTIEQYFQEYGVLEDKREKVLMGITPLVYDRNQYVIKWEKISEGEEKKKIEGLIAEKDKAIKQKTMDILSGKEVEIPYDF